jgi:2-polyprenyl-6-methoxyphenol hydroxylase-like FAD-dependent oxidoreductase
MQQFEFVVIGGGSAGMALAARLSQVGRKTLLLGRTSSRHVETGQNNHPEIGG